MLKFLCLLFIFAAVANAGKLTLNFDSMDFVGSKGNSYIELKETTGKFTFIWKTNVNYDSTPLRATLDILYLAHETIQNATLDNICNEYNKNTVESAFQQFILKLMANTEKCPIQEGSTSSLSVPFTYSYNMENPTCGPIRTEMKIFKKTDSDNSDPLITGRFQGINNGC